MLSTQPDPLTPLVHTVLTCAYSHREGVVGGGEVERRLEGQ
jgi:hypothetical protein